MYSVDTDFLLSTKYESIVSILVIQDEALPKLLMKCRTAEPSREVQIR